jgi:hypothetical protein
VGIRPEHVAVLDGDSGEGVAGQVVLVESLGADSYVHAAIEGADTNFVARTEGYDARRPGTNVRLRIDPARVFGFDADSEERLAEGGANGGPRQERRSQAATDGETERDRQPSAQGGR